MALDNSDLITRARGLASGGRPGDAVTLLLEAERSRSLDPAAIRLLVQCLSQTGDLHAALDRQIALVPEDLESSPAQGRDDALAAAQLAQLSMAYEQSAEIARRLMARDPLDIEAAGLLSTLELWLHGPDRAQQVLASVIDQPRAPPHMLAEALSYATQPDPKLVARIEALAQDTRLAVQSRADLLLALAQFHDRQGAPEQAWHLAEKGNALAPPRPQQDWRSVLAIHRQIYRTMGPIGDSGEPRHLYLLGTPRSGQSLVQSMLAAAPDVGSLGERGALLQHILFRSGPIAQMPTAERSNYYKQLHESDLRGIARQLGPQKLVVDKSPLHLAVAGSIARIHPGAAFGAVLRNPADTAISIWLRSLPPIYDYANSLDAIFAQIDFAFDAFAAWMDEGIDIRLMDHQELVTAPASEGQALFDWLDLGWDPAFLEAERRTAPVATFSAAQVRNEISPNVPRGAAPYAAMLAPFADRIAALRAKMQALLQR